MGIYMKRKSFRGKKYRKLRRNIDPERFIKSLNPIEIMKHQYRTVLLITDYNLKKDNK